MSWQNGMGGYGGGYDQYSYTRRSPSYIPGKMINVEKDITPQDVPSNGYPAVFPTSDWNCIIAKAWSESGDRIETRRYVLEQVQDSQQNTDQTILNALALISGQMEELKKEMDDMKNTKQYHPYSNNRKKPKPKNDQEKKGE